MPLCPKNGRRWEPGCPPPNVWNRGSQLVVANNSLSRFVPHSESEWPQKCPLGNVAFGVPVVLRHPLGKGFWASSADSEFQTRPRPQSPRPCDTAKQDLTGKFDKCSLSAVRLLVHWVFLHLFGISLQSPRCCRLLIHVAYLWLSLGCFVLSQR